MQSEFEELYVRDAYNQISNAFDKTRVSHWKSVKKFVLDLKPESLVLDAGCGNGKNMQITDHVKYVGCDNCENLIDICKKKGLDVVLANIKKLPFPDNHFDAVMCIAVLHHIYDATIRFDVVKELMRVLKVSGKIIIQVWAKEQKLTERFMSINNDNDFFVTWKNNDVVIKRFYHLFSELEIDELVSLVCKDKTVTLIKKEYELDNWTITFLKLQ